MEGSGRILASLCATQETEGLKRSKDSLQKHGIAQFVFGLGAEWQGNGMKQLATIAAARSALGKFEFILSLDGYDTLCLASEAEIVEKFVSFQHPMVISAEMNCWPDAKMACLYPPSTSTSLSKFLNAGAYMARVEYVAAMLPEWGVTEDFKAGSDQRFITKVFLDHPGCMKIDTECVIFQSLCGVKPVDFILSHKRVVSKSTYQMPCVLHGNGGTNMDYYWDVIK